MTDGKRQVLYFDITSLRAHLRRNTRVSGIQRVSILFISEAQRILGVNSVRLVYFDAGEKRFFSSPEYGTLQTDNISLLRNQFDLPAEGEALPQVKNSPGLWGRFSRRYGRHSSPDAPTYEGQLGYSPIVNPCELDSKILLMDFGASTPEYFAAVEFLAKAGSKVISLIYDLIPIVRCEYVPHDVTSLFTLFIENTLRSSDRLIAISEATRRDLLDFMEERSINRNVAVVPLSRQAVKPPEDLRTANAKPANISSNVTEIIDQRFVLCVGTLEPRKNNLALALAWKSLAILLPGLPKLVFAGRRGWESETFFEFVSTDAWARENILVVIAPSDDELSHFYQNCLFTAFVSHYEGWGLPVGESIAYGKTVLASDNSSVPEVGQDLCIYCNSLDIKSIAAGALRLLTEPGLRESLEAKISKVQLRTWEDVAQDLLDLVFYNAASSEGSILSAV